MQVATLIGILLILAVIAVVLIGVAWKLLHSTPDPTPDSKPAPEKKPTPPPTKADTSPAVSGVRTSVKPVKETVKKPPKESPKPAKKQETPRQDMESFDICPGIPADVWTCPACGAENRDKTRCQVCAEQRV